MTSITRQLATVKGRTCAHRYGERPIPGPARCRGAQSARHPSRNARNAQNAEYDDGNRRDQHDGIKQTVRLCRSLLTQLHDDPLGVRFTTAGVLNSRSIHDVAALLSVSQPISVHASPATTAFASRRPDTIRTGTLAVRKLAFGHDLLTAAPRKNSLAAVAATSMPEHLAHRHRHLPVCQCRHQATRKTTCTPQSGGLCSEQHTVAAMRHKEHHERRFQDQSPVPDGALPGAPKGRRSWPT